MATLVIIGTKTINMDQVTEILDQGDILKVIYGVGLYTSTSENQELDYSEFRNEEAELLRWWIQNNAVNVAEMKAKSEKKTPPIDPSVFAGTIARGGSR